MQHDHLTLTRGPQHLSCTRDDKFASYGVYEPKLGPEKVGVRALQWQ